MRHILSAALTLVVSSALAAQQPPAPAPEPPSAAMSVAAFLERLGEVSQSGPGWTETPEAAQLFEAVAGAGKAYRRDLAARAATGQPVEACLPPTQNAPSTPRISRNSVITICVQISRTANRHTAENRERP